MAILVLGLGKTGRSLAKYFHSQGETVWGVDDGEPDSEVPWNQICSEVYFSGKQPDLDQVTRFFISPGVRPDHPLAARAKQRGLPLEGELDLAASLTRGILVGITGTNGKSTTTALLGAMCQHQGWNTGIGGNLGTPYLDLVTSGKNYTHYVIEVSSFQLESSRRFHPHIAILLNLSEDHFDRHPDLSHYLAAKQIIFKQQEPTDFAIYNDDDLYCLQAVEGSTAKKIPFSTAKPVLGTYGSESTVIWQGSPQEKSSFSLTRCSLKGLHNLENISAAVAAAKCLGIGDSVIQETLDRFEGLPHRMQWVARHAEVDFYDDSKATNVGAVVMSLASFDGDVVLIMGGVDKGGDYLPLKPLLKAKVKAAIVMGEASEKIQKSLASSTEFVPVDNMKQAIEAAWSKVGSRGTILLAPACSSFDMYRNYQERGADFQNQVKTLIEHLG